MSTQEAFGQVIVDLAKDATVGPYIVTTAPDVATSTNLAGFINRAGVFAPVVYLAASGAVMPEVLAAAATLANEEIAAYVVDVTSLDRLYAAWRATIRDAVAHNGIPALPGVLRAVFPVRAPIVTVHDASSHAMAWLGSALGVPAIPLGVDAFVQSGTVGELYELHHLVPDAIVNAAIAALALI